MKIFIVCSKHFYGRASDIKKELEQKGHKVMLPTCFEDPFKENKMKEIGEKEHIKFKQEMMKLIDPTIKKNDAILVLNFEKNNQPNYIGGSTFMEIVKAWELNKKIFLFNPLPVSILSDELHGINPIILNGDLNKILK